MGKGFTLRTRGGGVIINGRARIGDYCKIHAAVNIGAKGEGVPTLGNHVYVGPGAKIFGGIRIADGIQIGANAVVNKSFSEENISIAGVPARKIEKRGGD